jgi:hypothetical protein
MFGETKSSGACRDYEVRLEDFLNGCADAELEPHLAGCSRCSVAVENARLAGSWLRHSWTPAAEPRSTFLGNVMARIREEKERADSAAAFWSILESLASRLALTAAVLLLAVSAYLAGAASRPVVIVPTRTELTSADFPQPPAEPVSNEEVMQSLAESSYGQ